MGIALLKHLLLYDTEMVDSFWKKDRTAFNVIRRRKNVMLALDVMQALNLGERLNFM